MCMVTVFCLKFERYHASRAEGDATIRPLFLSSMEEPMTCPHPYLHASKPLDIKSERT